MTEYSYHDMEGLGSVHQPHDLQYANQTSRKAGADIEAKHVGRLAEQQDDGSFWILTNDDPVTWDTFTPPAALVADAGKILRAVSDGDSGIKMEWGWDVMPDGAESLLVNLAEVTGGADGMKIENGADYIWYIASALDEIQESHQVSTWAVTAADGAEIWSDDYFDFYAAAQGNFVSDAFLGFNSGGGMSFSSVDETEFLSGGDFTVGSSTSIGIQTNFDIAITALGDVLALTGVGIEMYSSDVFNLTVDSDGEVTIGGEFSLSVDGGDFAVFANGGDMIMSATGQVEYVPGADFRINAGDQIRFRDQYWPGSPWLDDLFLSNASAEWTTYRANFGEVSLLNALNQLYTLATS